MDLSSITQFKLTLGEIPEFKRRKNFSFRSVQYSNANEFRDEVEHIIDCHHKDLKWDGIPTYSDVLERLKFGSKLNLWLEDEKPIGWHWYNKDYITIDWKTPLQKLNPEEAYAGAAFLSNREGKLLSPALFFYSAGFEDILLREKKKIIYCYVDNWNTTSINLCLKSGMRVFEFIKT